MAVVLGLLLLSILAAEGHEVHDPRFPVEPDFPIWDPVSPGYLPHRPKVPHQHHSYLSQGPSVSQGPPQQHGGFPPQGPSVFQYHSYPIELSHHYGLDKPTKVARPGKHYPGYPPQGPSVPKKRHSYPRQGSKNPRQKTYSTTNPQRKPYLDKLQGKTIKLPTKTYIAINRLFRRRHY